MTGEVRSYVSPFAGLSRAQIREVLNHKFDCDCAPCVRLNKHHKSRIDRIPTTATATTQKDEGQ